MRQSWKRLCEMTCQSKNKNSAEVFEVMVIMAVITLIITIALMTMIIIVITVKKMFTAW